MQKFTVITPNQMIYISSIFISWKVPFHCHLFLYTQLYKIHLHLI